MTSAAIHTIRHVRTCVFRINAQQSLEETMMFETYGGYVWDMYVHVPIKRPHFAKMRLAGLPMFIDGGPYKVKYVVVTMPNRDARVAFGFQCWEHLYLGWLDEPSTCRYEADNQDDPLLRRIHRYLAKDAFNNWYRFLSGGILCA